MAQYGPWPFRRLVSLTLSVGGEWECTVSTDGIAPFELLVQTASPFGQELVFNGSGYAQMVMRSTSGLYSTDQFASLVESVFTGEDENTFSYAGATLLDDSGSAYLYYAPTGYGPGTGSGTPGFSNEAWITIGNSGSNTIISARMNGEAGTGSAIFSVGEKITVPIAPGA